MKARDWVLVSGAFGSSGGQDRANHALARWLLAQGCRVHLVAHAVEAGLAATPGAVVALVPKPFGSIILGQRGLDRTGRAVTASVRSSAPTARVVVNGGNCRVADASWVHFVHAAWEPRVAGAPLGGRLKARLATSIDRREERAVLGACRIAIANSERTRQDVIRLGVPAERVQLVWLGADPVVPPSPEAKRAARSAFGVEGDRLLVVFVGALGWDARKGLDTLLAAWPRLGEGFVLRVAGGGALSRWRLEAARHGVGPEVFLGHTDRVATLVAAADLLVSPVRYEPYGLNVQEALVAGVPAIVTRSAGVAERYPAALRELLVEDPDDAAELATRILAWRGGRERFAAPLAALGEELRGWTWDRMAEALVAAVEGTA